MRILMLDLDTLRPDHLGCYGYYRCTSPVIDSIADESLRFTNYYCSDAPCLPSRAALCTGRFGIHNGINNHGGTASDLRLLGEERGMRDDRLEHSLFNIFRKAGMHTVSVSTFAERHSAFWFNAGFNEMINVGMGGAEIAQTVADEAVDWLSRKGRGDNWFMHVHMWDPHAPYRTPEDYEDPFLDTPMTDWITEEIFQEHLQKVGQHSLHELGGFKENPRFAQCPKAPQSVTAYADLRKVTDGYDSGIRYMDGQIGRIIDLLKEQGIYDDTAIIITSDHGEDMGELGIYSEHGIADYHVTHIPMIIRWPGVAPAVHDHFLYNLDLAPTLCDLLDVKPYPWWDGLSYAGFFGMDKPVPEREALIVTQCAHVCQRGVRFDHYHYIRTYHSGYHLFPREMLFDIEADVHEQHNLAEERPDLCAIACRYLTDWQEDMMLTSEDDRDPLWTTLLEGGPLHAGCDTAAYYQRLLDTGRTEGAAAFKARFGGEFGQPPHSFRMTL